MANVPTRLVSEVAVRIADLLDRAIREHFGPDATFEQHQDLAAALAGDGLWFRSDRALREAITTADEVEVDGRRFGGSRSLRVRDPG